MTGFLIRRVLQSLLILFLVTVFTLALVHLFPGGPIKSLLGPRATPQQVAYYNHLYGFDQPFYVQYLKWIQQILSGNLGFSTKLNQSVSSLIAQDLPKTAILAVLGLGVSLAFGIPLGIYQAVKRYTKGDYILTGISFLGYATPTFFVGLLLVEWFAIDIPLFPRVSGEQTFHGSFWGNNADLSEVMALAAEGKIQHTIKTIGFDQINEYLNLMRGNDIVGRAVVKF